MAQTKPILTVLDLTSASLSRQEMKTVVSLLTSSLLRTRKYVVIDTAERDNLLKETEFSNSDCSDEACQIKLGKQLAAELIVVGSLNKVGTRFVLALKMLETGTSRTVATADGKYADIDGLIDDLDGMASTIAGVPISVVDVKTILSLAGIVAGLGAGGAGGYFIYDALNYLNGTVNPAYSAYNDLPMTSPQTLFDSMYGTYAAAYGEFQSRLLAGALVAGAGVALTVVSLIYLLPPEKVQKPVVTAMLGLRPFGDRVTLSLKLSM